MRKTVSGRVQRGSQKAASLGFPTVNIPLTDPTLSGIYAGVVRAGAAEYPAALYADQKRALLEAHLLDFSADLYGSEVEMELLEKVRDDRRFDTDKMLMRAIASDVERVRAYFQNS